MEENYYEILEVNKNASPEIIEKAYKTLVKKYHPDLQEDNLKNIYEEKIKKINKAYDVLSNSEKRKNYDLNLNNTIISSDDYNNLINENINLKKEINYLKNNLNDIEKNINNNYNNSNNKNNYNNTEHMNNNSYEKHKEKIYTNHNNINSSDSNLNINYITENWIKNFIALFITIFIIIIVGFTLWHIPITKKYLLNLYYKTPLLQYIISIFIKIFN